MSDLKQPLLDSEPALSAASSVTAAGSRGFAAAATAAISAVATSQKAWGRSAAAAAAAAARTGTQLLLDDVVAAAVLQFASVDDLLDRLMRVCRTWHRAAQRSHTAWRSFWTTPFATHLSAAVDAHVRAHPHLRHGGRVPVGDRDGYRYGDHGDHGTPRDVRCPLIPGVCWRVWAYNHWHAALREWCVTYGLPVRTDWTCLVPARHGRPSAIIEGDGFAVALHAPGLPWSSPARQRRDAAVRASAWCCPPRVTASLDADARAEHPLPPPVLCAPALSAETAAAVERDAADVQRTRTLASPAWLLHDTGAHRYMALPYETARALPYEFPHAHAWTAVADAATRRDALCVFLPPPYTRPVIRRRGGDGGGGGGGGGGDRKQNNHSEQPLSTKSVLSAATALGFGGVTGALMGVAAAALGLDAATDAHRASRPWHDGPDTFVHVVPFDAADLALADAERHDGLVARGSGGGKLQSRLVQTPAAATAAATEALWTGYGIRHTLPRNEHTGQWTFRYTPVPARDVQRAYASVDGAAVHRLVVALRRQLSTLVAASYTEAEREQLRTGLVRPQTLDTGARKRATCYSATLLLWLLLVASVLVPLRVDFPGAFGADDASDEEEDDVDPYSGHAMAARLTSWVGVVVPCWLAAVVCVVGTARVLLTPWCCGAVRGDARADLSLYERAYVWYAQRWGHAHLTAAERAVLCRQRLAVDRVWLCALANVLFGVAVLLVCGPLALAGIPLGTTTTTNNSSSSSSSSSDAAVEDADPYAADGVWRMKQLAIVPLCVSLLWVLVVHELFGPVLHWCARRAGRHQMWFSFADAAAEHDRERISAHGARTLLFVLVCLGLVALKLTSATVDSHMRWIECLAPLWLVCGVGFGFLLSIVLLKPCACLYPYSRWPVCGAEWNVAFRLLLTVGVGTASLVLLSLKGDGLLPDPNDGGSVVFRACVLALPLQTMLLLATLFVTFIAYEWRGSSHCSYVCIRRSLSLLPLPCPAPVCSWDTHRSTTQAYAYM